MVDWDLAIDFGTAHTSAAIGVRGRPEPIDFGGRPYISAAVFVTDDNAAGPDGAVGGVRVGLADAVTAVLRQVVDAAKDRQGGTTPHRLVLTVPATSGSHELDLMRVAHFGLELPPPQFLPEPIAAAQLFRARHPLPENAGVAILDIGAGSADITLVRQAGGDLIVTGPSAGTSRLSGRALDVVFAELVADRASVCDKTAWELFHPFDDARTGLSANPAWQLAVTRAREVLSTHAETIIDVADRAMQIRVLRTEFEDATRDLLADGMRRLQAALGHADLGQHGLAAVFLTGGACRTPGLELLVRQTVKVPVVTAEVPEATNAVGALTEPPPRTRSYVSTTDWDSAALMQAAAAVATRNAPNDPGPPPVTHQPIDGPESAAPRSPGWSSPGWGAQPGPQVGTPGNPPRPSWSPTPTVLVVAIIVVGIWAAYSLGYKHVAHTVPAPMPTTTDVAQPQVGGEPSPNADTATATATEQPPTPTTTDDTTVAEPSLTTTSSPTLDPAHVVVSYFNALNARDYSAAWALGGDNLDTDYTSWVNGFQTTMNDAVTAQDTSPDTAEIQLVATQQDGSRLTFAGTYTVANGVITHADIQRTS